VIEEKNDKWLVYQLGGHSLSKECFDIKGEFFNGERIYKVNPSNNSKP
jgi:hypothetical protein